MITDLYNLKGVHTTRASSMGMGGREGNGRRGRGAAVQGKLATICRIPRKAEDALEAFGVGSP